MHRLKAFLSFLFVFSLLFGSLPVSAQEEDPRKVEDPGYLPDAISLNAAGPGLFITGPQEGNPLDIGLRYLDRNKHLLSLSAADLAGLVVLDSYTSEHSGVTHIYLRQTANGIEVDTADININVARDGSVMSLYSTFIPRLNAAINRANPGQPASRAVEAAARSLGLELERPLEVLAEKGGPARGVVFSDAGISEEGIPARLVYRPVAPGVVRLSWQLEIHEPGGDHVWVVSVDAASGEVLAKEDLVVHDNFETLANVTGRGLPVPTTVSAATSFAYSYTGVEDGSAYNVFALPLESAGHGDRSIVTNPAHATASPFGWHDTNGAPGPEFTRTRGNNVHAYTDVDANNVADPGSDPDGGPGLQFDFPLDLATQQPSAYRPAAVANLFYWNNIIHDVFYLFGFTEAAGNFQVNNYGRGGAGNDDVRAEAQDGSGTNNANFFTPTDGSRPRMQMFVWTAPFNAMVTVNQPSPIAGDFGGAGAGFGPSLLAVGPITADVVLALDAANAAGPSETDGCTALTNAADVAGRIAIVDRGTCPFVDKVKNAQNAGAVAVIVANNVAGAPIAMGGADATIVIPSMMVSLANGNTMKANLPFNATMSGVIALNRDSDLDAGVIIHEYAHGISNRLTGGRTNISCLSNQEQMGEGWSDWLALALTARPGDTAEMPRGVGSYLLYQPIDGVGIRPTPYTTNMSINPSTYDTIKTAAVPHGVGYVWSTMLWDVYWNLVNKHGYNPDVYQDWSTGGNNLAIQLVMDGMKIQPCSPGFVTGRNAILEADVALTGGQNACEIWQGFARRGLGVNAAQGSSNNRSDGVEDFTLPAACTTTLGLDTPAAAQYSDLVTLNASVVPALFGGLPVTGSVEFFLEGASLGTAALDASGLAALSFANDLAAGNYSVSASFTPSGPEGVGPSSAGPVTLTITKENAAVTFTGDAFAITAGPNIPTAPVHLSASLVQEDDGYPGDLSLATVAFELFKSSNMTPIPDLVIGGIPVDGSGLADTVANLAEDVYTVRTRIEASNSYWTGPADMSTVTVVLGSTERRVTGGGWVPDSASENGKANFGFTVRPNRNNIRGNAIFLFHGTDGYDYLVKSTSWQGGSLGFFGSPVTRASFNGRATVQKIDRITGEIVASFGNYTFFVDLLDGDLRSPRESDRYGITVRDNGGNIWHQVGTSNNPVELGGGNVQIKE